MNTLRLTRKDFDENNACHKDIDFDGDVEIEGLLGIVSFEFGLRTSGHLYTEAGTGIIAGEGIKAGTGIIAGEGIIAGWGIKAGTGIIAGEGIKAGTGIIAGEGIEAGAGIKAGWGIIAGWGIKAGTGIIAGEGIEAGTGLEAGEGIEAGWGIITFRSGIRAESVSCLRVVVGFDLHIKAYIEAKVKGEVVLGEVRPPNPLPKSIYALHVHHMGSLFEVLTEPIQNRVEYIKNNKPIEEVATRLRLLRVVKDQEGVRRAIARGDSAALDAIHKKECESDCPWDGHTIFPNSRR